MRKGSNLTHGLLTLILTALVAACSGSDRDETEAARAYSLARDVEGDIERIDEAIAEYRKIADQYPSTPTGKQAATRADQLGSITGMLAEYRSAPEDSLPTVSAPILQAAPNYEPVLFKLGEHYAARAQLYTRVATKFRGENRVNRLVRVWAYQDSLWSGYDFRPTHKDRTMRDLLCRHAVDTARMLEDYKRYADALEIVQRGIEYGSSKEWVDEAKVFASFYRFRTGDEDGAFALAGEALENDALDKPLLARAHHVRGMISTYRYQDKKETTDLDQAIKSLNEAVVLDPGMADARALLKELRRERGKLQTS